MVKTSYSPIDCSYYDILEATATSKKIVRIKYLSEGEVKHVDSRIKDLQTRSKEEFLVLSESLELRLDQIISVDGFLRSDYNFC